MNKYFTTVKDIFSIKPGDILVWKKETGKTPKLHLTPGSMRSLGVSIGRRYRALSYSQIDMLIREPEKTRYYMVYNTWLNTTSEARTAMSFDECPRQSVYKTAILEFPMDPKEARNDSSGIGDYIYKNLIERLDCIIKGIPEAFKKTVTADLVVGAGGAKPVSEYRATLPGEHPSHNVDDVIKALITGTSYSYLCDNEVFSSKTPVLPTIDHTTPGAREDKNIKIEELKELAANVMKTHKCSNCNSTGNFSYIFGIRVIAEAIKRGAVMIRPTEAFWKQWTSRFLETVKHDCAERYAEVEQRLVTISKLTNECIKTVKSRRSKLNHECEIDRKTADKLEKGVYDELAKI